MCVICGCNVGRCCVGVIDCSVVDNYCWVGCLWCLLFW